MRKIIALAFVAFFVFPAILFAAEKSFKITTYYPAPYGEYKTVKAKNLEIGKTGDTGTIKIVDGNQADGKVLTSDASGNAQWKNTSGGGISESGWGYVCNNYSDAHCTKITLAGGSAGGDYPSRRVSFTKTYTKPPIVIATSLSCRPYASGLPTDMTDFDEYPCYGNQTSNSWMITDIDTHGFTYLEFIYVMTGSVGFTYMVIERS